MHRQQRVDRRPPAALRGGGKRGQLQAARAARFAESPAQQLRMVARDLSQRQWREDLACRMRASRDLAERRRLFFELYGDLVPFEATRHSVDSVVLRCLGELRSGCVLPAVDWYLDRVNGQLPPGRTNETERRRRRAAAIATAWSWVAPGFVQLVLWLFAAYVAVRIVLSPVFFVLVGYFAAIVGGVLLVMVAPAVTLGIRRTVTAWRLKPQRDRLRGNQTTCCICLEGFELADGDRYRDNGVATAAPPAEVEVLVCGHCFHVECIVPWLEVKSCCPVCKQETQ